MEPAIYTFTGRYAGLEDKYESPSLYDIAVATGRIFRYAGNSREPLPVLLHAMVCAELSAPPFQAYALTHDAVESMTGDCTGPFKPKTLSEFEDKMLAKIHLSLGIPPMTVAEAAIVKEADLEALAGEAFVLGPPRLSEHPWFVQHRSPRAEKIVKQYLREYPCPSAYTNPRGSAVLAFLRKFQQYKNLMLRRLPEPVQNPN